MVIDENIQSAIDSLIGELHQWSSAYETYDERVGHNVPVAQYFRRNFEELGDNPTEEELLDVANDALIELRQWSNAYNAYWNETGEYIPVAETNSRLFRAAGVPTIEFHEDDEDWD